MAEIDNRKQLILDTALQIFSRDGFHKAKITKIAEIAGIGAGSVYLFFKTKESILEELFIRSWSAIELSLVQLTENNKLTPKEKLTEFLRTVFGLVTQNKDLAKLVLHEYSFWSSDTNHSINLIVEHSKSLLSEIIKSGCTTGDFRKELNSDYAVIFLIGGLWQLQALISDRAEDLMNDNILSDINDLVLKGLQ